MIPRRTIKEFKPGVKMTLFVLLMLPLLLSLGAWQLRRGAEKQALQAVYLSYAGALPIAVTAKVLVDRSERAFQRLRLSGQYQVGQYYLIDNQVRDGQVGYWVVQWFVTDDQRAWLVNRGFVAAGPQRSQLPAVVTPAGPLQLVVLVWPDTGLVPLLAAEPATGSWPRLRQRLDAVAMAAEWPGGQPVEMRLEPGQPGVLQAAPMQFISGADRHRGYAVQWFGLAAALVIGYLVFGWRQAQLSDDRQE